jgi:hypothetical protein
MKPPRSERFVIRKSDMPRLCQDGNKEMKVLNHPAFPPKQGKLQDSEKKCASPNVCSSSRPTFPPSFMPLPSPPSWSEGSTTATAPTVPSRAPAATMAEQLPAASIPCIRRNAILTPRGAPGRSILAVRGVCKTQMGIMDVIVTRRFVEGHLGWCT